VAFGLVAAGQMASTLFPSSPGDRLCVGKGEPYLRKAYLYAFTKVYQDWAGEFSIFRPSSLNLPVS